MKLTACYMVKNEASNLPRSLASIRGAWDELIVVDTGSEDATRAIAASFGAQVLDVPWCDDFSAPRNAAVDAAQGDWILFLDADEYFESDCSLRERIEGLVTSSEKDAWLILRKNMSDMDGTSCSMDYAVRLVRNMPAIRYEGRIHEHITRAGGALSIGYAPKDLALVHTGYRREVVRGKMERNLRLLQEAVKEEGEELPYACYLADCHYGLGQYEKAIRYARMAIEGGVVIWGDASALYHLVLESMRHLQYPPEEQLAWARHTAERFPGLPDHLADCGIILSSMGRLVEARAFLEEALAHYDRADYSLQDGSFFQDGIASRIAERLERIALVMQERAAARKWHERAAFYAARQKGGERTVRITACYIVGDEAEELQKSLESIVGEVDAILVVHTGRGCTVPNVARSFHAAVYPFAWCDDFSAARNAALENATGEWILFLDADEYLSETTRGHLRAAIAREAAAGTQQLLFPIRNIEAGTGETLLVSCATRAFARREGRAYVGRIHEEIRDDAKGTPRLVEPMRRIAETELMLIHTGYSAARSKEKAERNLRILLKELVTAAYPESLYMYLAEAYDGIGDAEHAIYYAKRDLATGGHKGVAYASRSHRILLRLYAESRQYEARMKVAEQAVHDFPDLPDFHAEYAECLADALDYEAALMESERAAKLAAAYHGIEPSMLDPAALSVMERRRAVWQAIRVRAAEMKLFACLIVRDAGKDFEIWAENAKAYADALIVVDTGSKDGTRERAVEAGARVITLAWQGDFAAARNTALAAAKEAGADWVTVLDADETFFDPSKVRLFAARTDLGMETVDAVQLPILHVDEDDGGREIKRQPYIRLLRMGRGLFYEGRVHEQLRKAGGEPALWTEGRHLPIRHTGYSTGRIREKVRRNLALLLQEIAEGGKKPYHDRYLADCYYGLGDYEKALAHARAARRSSVHSIGAESDLFRLMLDAMRELSAPRAEQAALAREAVAAFPLLPDFYGRLGILLAPSAPTEALPLLQKAIALAETGTDGKEASQFADEAAETHAALAACHFACGAREAAEREALMAISLDGHEAQALDVLCALHADLGAGELAALLVSILGEGDAVRPYLLRFAESYGHIALYRQLSKDWQTECEISAFYDKAKEEEAASLLAKLAPEAAQHIREAPAVLLMLERQETPEAAHLALRLAALMPPAMQALWQAYRGADLPHGAWADGWNLFAPAFVRWGSDAQVVRVLPLVSALGDAEKAAFFHQLVMGRRFAAAVSSAGLVPADSPAANGKFWYDLGRAFFAMDERKTARECWERAISLDPAHGGARAYLVWTAQDDGKRRDAHEDHGLLHRKK
ncbi:MAG: glycosyltransferase [Mitsuokella sp.]